MKKLTVEQRAILENGVRWCTNILTEISGNYGHKLSLHRRSNLLEVLRCLHEVIGPNPEPPEKK